MHRSSLIIIFLIVFIDLVGFGIVIPILPYYAREFGASGWELGWLMTSYSLMQFLFSPFWGRISDRYGRRPILLMSILGTGIFMAVLGFADSLLWLFIGRTLAGFFGANISTAYAYVSDVTTPENRAKGMGLVGAAFGLGFIFGPAIGGLLSQWGYSTPMFVGAALALLNFVFAIFKLKEPAVTAEIRAANRHKRFDLDSIRRVLASPVTRLSVLLFLLLTFAVTQMEVTFALYMGAHYDYDAREAGALLALMGVIMVIMQGGLIGRLARRYGELKLVVIGSLICSVALASFAATTVVFWAVVALSALALGHGMLHPSLSSLASRGASIDNRGATMGVFQSAGSLARVIGPPCAGWLYDQVSHGSPFYFGSAVLAVCFVIALKSLRA